MKNYWKYGLLVLLSMVGLGTVGAQQSLCSQFQILQNDNRQFAFELTIGDLSVKNNENRTSTLVAEGFRYRTQTPNSFSLPSWNQLISIPDEAKIRIDIIEDEVMEVSLSDLGAVYPFELVQIPHTKSNTLLDDTVGSIPLDSLIRVQDLGSMRGIRQALVSIMPFSVDTLRQMLIVHQRIVCSISFLGTDGNPRKSISNIMVPERYVIVSPLEFHETLQPFIDWKRQIGFEVELLASDELHRDSIRSILQGYYKHSTLLSPSPSYVLLVGDVDKLMSYPGRKHLPGVGSHLTDLYYVEYTDDALPEVKLGRLSVEDTLQLRQVLTKIIQYERFDVVDTQFLNRVLLVAGEENQPPADLMTNAQVNYLGNQLLDFNTLLDTLCFRNSESNLARDSILNALVQGAAHINYSGHCRYKGWVRPNIEASSIDSLPSNQKYAFVVNNCCSSNNYSATCFGEQLLRKDRGGAIGVIGASNETLWDEDFYWSVGAKYPVVSSPVYDSRTLGSYDRLLGVVSQDVDSKVISAADMLWAGNEAVMQSGSPYYQYYWEVYNLLGDPSLMPYIGIPEHLSVSIASPITIGDSRLHVVGNPGTRVSLLQNGKLLGVCVLNDFGESDIHLRYPILDTLILTATHQFFRPQIDTLVPFSASGPRVVVLDAFVGDSNLNPNGTSIHHGINNIHLVLANCGSEVAHTVRIGSNVADTILFVADSMVVGSIDTITFAFFPEFEVSDAVFPIDIQIQTADTVAHQTFYFDVVAPKVLIQQVQLSENGFPVSQLLPRKEYAIEIDMEIQNPVASQPLKCTLHYLNGVVDTTPKVEELVVGNQDVVRMAVSDVFLTKDTLSNLDMLVQVHCVGFDYFYPIHFLAGTIVETFEYGNFAQFPWDTTRNLPWRIDTVAHQGSYSAKSAHLHSRQQSDLCIGLSLSAIDTLSFWAKVASRSADKLQFVVDGNVRKSWSGELDWFFVRQAIPAGHHQVCWRYLKESSDTTTYDCAWVDDIQLPFASWNDTSVGYDQWVIADTALDEIDDVDLFLEKSPLQLYPNPAKDHVLMVLHPDITEAEIIIFDSKGVQVDDFFIKNDAPAQYFTHNLRLGCFNVVCRTPKGVFIQRLIIVK